MGKIKEGNIVGARIGLFDILYECDFKSSDGHKLYHIKCSKCGWENDSLLSTIKRFKNNCKHRNKAGQYSINKCKLKWKNKRIKKIYQGILERCYNEKDKAYRWYGGKGVKVCKEWIDNPLLFEDWALSNGYKEKLTIDRKDESKGYSPDNCRWVTVSDNAKYKSTTRILEVDGIRHTGREWADVLGIGTNTVNSMLRQYPKEQVEEFIRRRIKEPNKTRKSKQSWMNVYGL